MENQLGGILPIKIGGIDLSSHGEFLRTLFTHETELVRRMERGPKGAMTSKNDT